LHAEFTGKWRQQPLLAGFIIVGGILLTQMHDVNSS
jgi:hypothetical protein